MKHFALLIVLLSVSFCVAQDAKLSTTADELLATLKRPCKFDLSSLLSVPRDVRRSATEIYCA